MTFPFICHGPERVLRTTPGYKSGWEMRSSFQGAVTQPSRWGADTGVDDEQAPPPASRVADKMQGVPLQPGYFQPSARDSPRPSGEPRSLWGFF